MSTNTENIETLLERSKQRERKARRAALVMAVVPLVIALLFLGFTLWNIYLAQERLVTVKDNLNSAETALLESTQALQTADSRLAISNQNIVAAQAQVTARSADLNRLSGQVEQAGQRLGTATAALATAQVDLAAKQKAYDDLNHQVQLATQFTSVWDYYQWQIWLKEITNHLHRIYPNDREAVQQGENLFSTLDRLFERNPPFNGYGTTIDEGFTSPSFAAFVLVSANRIPPPDFPILVQSDLRAYLLANGMKIRQGAPKDGDLILYRDGFCMFYLTDDQNQRHVIGMTVSRVKVFAADFHEKTDVIAVLP